MKIKELKYRISTGARFLRNDTNTYLWAKSQRNFLSDSKNYENSDYELGGGNFFIALSALSFLSFLAKIYKILRSDDPEKLFNKNGIFKNEPKAVEEFVKDISDKIKIVDVTKNIGYWILLRHGLVHLFWPKEDSFCIEAANPVDFYYAGMSLFEYKHFLKNTQEPAITKNDNNGFICFADLLAFRVCEAAEWLIQYIDINKDKLSDNKKEKVFDILFDIQQKKESR